MIKLGKMCYYKIVLNVKLNVSIFTKVHGNKTLPVYTIPFPVKSPSNTTFFEMSKKKDEPTVKTLIWFLEQVIDYFFIFNPSLDVF